MKEQPLNLNITKSFQLTVKERSDRRVNYSLALYFTVGIALAQFHSTWFTAVGVGGISLIVYYSTKIMLPNYTLYQYVLSAVLGIFMVQFIYQMNGQYDLYFFAFIGSALLVSYQQWKLQIPIAIVVVVNQVLLSHFQKIGFSQVYFTQLIIHVTLAAIAFFICGLWSYELYLYNEKHIVQTIKMAEQEKKVQLLEKRAMIANDLEERNTILESITDAFFAVDYTWTVLYWNNMAEKALSVSKNMVVNRNLWDIFTDSVGSTSYRQYQKAMKLRQQVQFEDYYPPLKKWYDITAYPSANGLSVYFKDITRRKLTEMRLIESEKRYNDLFHLSPLPMWVFDVETAMFLDVNESAIRHYGYTMKEFLSMTIKDIRPEEDVLMVERIVTHKKNIKKTRHEQMFKHRIKCGRVIYVEIQSTAITYHGRQAKVVLAHDITEQLRYTRAIEEQNEKLKEIAWIQSHMVRAPLAKITALIPLIIDEKENVEEKEKMLNYLWVSANELDQVITHITDKTDITEAPR